MKTYIFIAALVCSINAFASGCLDLTGSYDMTIYGGKPKCANGLKVEKSWFKYEQTKCKSLSYSKIYKLVDGTFCESIKTSFVADGQERSYGNPDILSKIEMFSDKQVFTSRSVSSGTISSSTKTLDSNGNLVVDDSSGFHEVYERSPIQ